MRELGMKVSWQMRRRKWSGMKMIQWALLLVLGAGMLIEGALGDQQKVLVDFGKKNSEIRMGITDDGVMGGLSKGKVELTQRGTAMFSGTLSLKNNGGFSSLRMAGGDWNCKGWNGIVLKVRGDGRTYNLRLTTDERFRGSAVSFQGAFKTMKDEWTLVKVPFSALQASWRGRALSNQFDPSKLEGLGVTLADKKPGQFRLEIASIKAWK